MPSSESGCILFILYRYKENLIIFNFLWVKPWVQRNLSENTFLNQDIEKDCTMSRTKSLKAIRPGGRRPNVTLEPLTNVGRAMSMSNLVTSLTTGLVSS
jgi:hypothetical protein